MRIPFLWLLLAGLIALLLGAWALTQLGSAPPPPRPRGEAANAFEMVDHWLIGPGAITATVQLVTQGPEGAPVNRQLFALSLATADFQGMIVLTPEGERWLRRNDELYRFQPEENEDVVSVPPEARRTPFLGSALSVEDFFFGFRLHRYHRSAQEPLPGGRHRVVFSPLSGEERSLTYRRIQASFDLQGRLVELEAYDADDRLVRAITVVGYVDFQGTSVIERAIVRSPLTDLQTEVVISGRKTHALPSFAFTPELLKGMEVEFKKSNE